jgi:hypothetical protein
MRFPFLKTSMARTIPEIATLDWKLANFYIRLLIRGQFDTILDFPNPQFKCRLL